MLRHSSSWTSAASSDRLAELLLVLPPSSRAFANLASFSSSAFIARALSWTRQVRFISNCGSNGDGRKDSLSAFSDRVVLDFLFIGQHMNVSRPRVGLMKRLRTYSKNGEHARCMGWPLLEVSAQFDDVEAEVRKRADDWSVVRSHARVSLVPTCSNNNLSPTYAQKSGRSDTSSKSSETSPTLWSWFLFRKRR